MIGSLYVSREGQGEEAEGEQTLMQLPIGKPWFRIAGIMPWRFLWPLCWQGWACYLALPVWLMASVWFFLEMRWKPSDAIFYGWLLPTVGIWALIVGVKTDPKMPWRN